MLAAVASLQGCLLDMCSCLLSISEIFIIGSLRHHGRRILAFLHCLSTFFSLPHIAELCRGCAAPQASAYRFGCKHTLLRIGCAAPQASAYRFGCKHTLLRCHSFEWSHSQLCLLKMLSLLALPETKTVAGHHKNFFIKGQLNRSPKKIELTALFSTFEHPEHENWHEIHPRSTENMLLAKTLRAAAGQRAPSPASIHDWWSLLWRQQRVLRGAAAMR